jgi:hypothetical protein
MKKDIDQAIKSVQKMVNQDYETEGIEWNGTCGREVLKSGSVWEYKIKKCKFSLKRHCGMRVWKFKVLMRAASNLYCPKHKSKENKWRESYTEYCVCKCKFCKYIARKRWL